MSHAIGHAVRLEGPLNIYAAADLKPRILAALVETPEAVLDLSDIAEIDCAGIQLLLLWQREAVSAGRTARLQGVSASVMEVLALLGLDNELGCRAQLPADDAQRTAPRTGAAS